MATHEYRIKCGGCGLHYVVLSWDEHWAGGPTEGRRGGFCPECGMPGGKIVWGPVSTEKQIFESVPGHIGIEEREGLTGPIGVPPPMMITEAEPLGFGVGRTSISRGPYGTNEGDVWLAPDSHVQHELDIAGNGLVLVHEMLEKDGEVQEVVYTTADPEIISRASQGHERWIATQAAQN